VTSRSSLPRGSSRGAVKFRLRFGLLVITIVLSFFGARLVQLQALDPHAYAAMAQAEGVENVDLPAERGAILDRNGVELATSMDGLMVVGDPQLTREDASELASFLADELAVDYFITLDRLRREDSRFQYIARRVPATVARAVVDKAEERGFKGLSTRRDPIRTYPADNVAANIIGFIGDDEEAGPLGGLERTFDAQLAGVDGKARYQSGGGNRIPLGDSTIQEPRNGQDLQLTLDRDTQWLTQQLLGKAVRDSRAESGVAVVMDTHTGELLAYADYPTYNANKPLLTDEEYLGAKGVSDVYEPGSVEKALTAASLIDGGFVGPLDRFTIPPVITRDGWPIRDHWVHDTLRFTMTGVIAKSSNIGTTMASERMPAEQLGGYLHAFGLGQKTNVGIRGETAGVLPDASQWSDVTRANIAFGQGLSVNAIQMAAAINTIANKGLRVDPSLVRGSATTDDGREVGTSVAGTRRVVSEEAARQTMLMMERVMDPEDGVAPNAAVAGYRVAGKTGTAQRAENGAYVDEFTVSFAGFAPADDPRFTVYVVVHKPQNGLGGGAIAGPVFSKIMTYLLRHYSVPPTGTRPSNYRVSWGPETAE
jgi:cell division protein FtsI (penicillin-binding protein 3)